ncbi:aldehyde dehydrogenase (NADP(+)) [Aliikangiella sp. G2MR2-5]|uniref:aldehyde dehydrogenase (NADP(+)) n=1 Tax=Aliikangiella sp. G2MR2-5 TaxID=2788943 RepID=UPI0018AB65B8|nr:aldehyde dehydrogenase (NADP(+)) [Aliikangiella sp. G2MR2-5]
MQQKVLINGQWQAANAESEFSAFNPMTGEQLSEVYPVSSWSDIDKALSAAVESFVQLQKISRETVAAFLERYASLIDSNKNAIVEMANLETGLPLSPRLADVEIPRTVGQLRQAAQAAQEASWTQPTIDSANNIRSLLTAIGPVAVFGPNNFPLAFGSISGGDFAAAIAAGNPVIAKAHPSHPGTTRLFAELAQKACEETGLPQATVQLVYAMSNESGLKMVSDPRIAATGFTGSRPAGLALKKAAEDAGKLIYLELSSVNPVIVLSGALEQRGNAIAEEFALSCTMAAGQLCTKPGLLIVQENESTDSFVQAACEKFQQGPVGTLLSPNAADHIAAASSELVAAGATLLTSTRELEDGRFCHSNTLLEVSGKSFIADSKTFQTEIFGNASLIIRSESLEQTQKILSLLEGNLTGCVYSAEDGIDDTDYDLIAATLTNKVGRVINDKMPTGVAVSPAMNHGGPFPSSGHPGFTAVGLPAAIKRFAALKCFDNVRQHRLPDLLQDKNPDGKIWRLIDGAWTQGDLGA